jgi:hypothetical protein
MIIGFSGKMGVGKDYIAHNVVKPFIEKYYPHERCINLAFADQLKINTIINHKIPFDKVFVKKTNETRQLLQYEGTENGRNKYGKDIWINYTDNWIKVWKSRGFTTFCITDCRFKNEIDWIKKNGGVVIKIEAPNRSKKKFTQESNDSGDLPNAQTTQHQSEIELSEDDSSDFVFNNDSENLLDTESDSIPEGNFDKLPEGNFDKLYEFIRGIL